VNNWDASAGADFYEHSMQTHVHRWRKCIATGGDYVEQQCLVAENWLFATALLFAIYLFHFAWKYT
jgi:hypothetical protein